MISTAQRSDPQLDDHAAARQIARRLISSREPERAGSHATAHAAAGVCDDLYQELSRWVGPDGCHALFTRARAQAQTENPALGHIQLRARSEPYLDGISQSISAHGEAATAEAVESMLVRLVALLGRLIGDDMSTKLIERTMAASERGVATSDDRGEDA